MQRYSIPERKGIQRREKKYEELDKGRGMALIVQLRDKNEKWREGGGRKEEGGMDHAP